MKSVINPTDATVRAVSTCGTHICLIAVGGPRLISDLVFADACAKGCLPADPSVDNPATDIDERRVAQLVTVMNEVLDEGNESLLTMEGCPKASVLKRLFGEHNSSERQAAWHQVELTRDR